MRLLPQNIEAEKLVIGALLEQHYESNQVIELLKKEHFSDKKLGLLYSIIVRLHEANIPVSPISVFEQLKSQMEQISISYLSSLQGNSYPIYPARLIYEKWVMRNLIETANSIIEQAFDENNDVFDLASSAAERINNVIEGIVLNDEENLYERLDDVFNSIEERRTSQNSYGLQSQYFPTLNNWTGGIRERDYIQLSGKDKQGKSSFAIALSLDFAINQKVPVAIFSLEMENEILAWKAISSECNVEYQKLRNPKGLSNGEGELTLSVLEDVREEAVRKFKNAKIYTCDRIMNERQIKAKMKKMVKEHGIKFFVVDYIGLIPSTGKFQTRELEVAYLSRFFKNATKEIGASICVLSQQNRTGGIAESKGLDRDCDFAFSIQKPFEEGIKEAEVKTKTGTKKVQLTETDFVITITRSRHGYQGRQFIAGYHDNKFCETSSEDYPI